MGISENFPILLVAPSDDNYLLQPETCSVDVINGEEW